VLRIRGASCFTADSSVSAALHTHPGRSRLFDDRESLASVWCDCFLMISRNLLYESKNNAAVCCASSCTLDARFLFGLTECHSRASDPFALFYAVKILTFGFSWRWTTRASSTRQTKPAAAEACGTIYIYIYINIQIYKYMNIWINPTY